MSNTGDAESRDGLLIRRYCESGDHEAFDELCDRYWNLAYRTALQELSDHEGAQDCAAAVFATLAQRARGLSNATSLACWIFATSVFTARNARKVEARRQMNLKRYAETLSRRTARRDPSLSHALNESIEKLNRDQREAILLRFVQGLTFEEIAMRLGQTPDSVRMRVNRALENLRGSLAMAGYPLFVSGVTDLLCSKEHSPTRVTFDAPRVKAILAANAAAVRWAFTKLAAVAAVGLVIGGAGYRKVQEIHHQSEAAAILAALKETATMKGALRATLETISSTGNSAARSGGSLDLERPNRFRIEIDAGSYKSLDISDGRKVWSERNVAGQDPKRQERDATPEALKVAEMSSELAYVYLSGDLEGAVKLLLDKPEAPTRIDDADEAGKRLRVIEFKNSTGKGFVRYYLDSENLVVGIRSERPMLSITELPDGNRKEDIVLTSSSTFLKDLRLGESLPDSTFAFDARKSTAPLPRPKLVAVGSMAPDFSATDPVTNSRVTLSALLKTKKAVLLDFWFLGCPPCRQEMPELNDLYAEAKGRGLEILCINGSDGSDLIRRYFKEEKLTVRPLVAVHRKRSDVDEVALAYGVMAFPTNVLISSSGEVLWVGVGYNRAALTEALKKAGF